MLTRYIVDHSVMHINIESLFDTPQTNIECQLHFDLKLKNNKMALL